MKKIIKFILGEKLYKSLATAKYEIDLKKQLHDTICVIQQQPDHKRIFLFLTPIHSNIGDLAIAEAEMQFLKRNFSTYQIIEINHPLAYRLVKKAKDKIRPTDLIMLHGGGNLGNHYIHEEHARRMILKEFPENRIISFPQTAYYTPDERGAKELSVSQGIIAEHAHLTLVAREQTSYELMQAYFPKTKILLTPDIVLSMDETKPHYGREGIMMVMRQDGEKSLQIEDQRQIDQLIRRYAEKVTYSDMIYHKEVDRTQRYDEVLSRKFNEFKSHQLVVTDRLHGMVFAAITGTPCIALTNYNHKVSGTYAWIAHLDYIRYVEDLDHLKSAMEELFQLSTFDLYNPASLTDHYRLFIQEIDDAVA